MPSLPEFLDAAGAVGRVEIDRQFYIEHPAETDRHIGIAAEIKVQFERISQYHRHGGNTVQRKSLCKPVVGHKGEGIRQQHLLGKSEDKKVDTAGEGRSIRTAAGMIFKLRNHFFV